MPSLIHHTARLIGHQYWIPRGRDRLVRLLANPDRMPPTPFKMNFFGAAYTGDLSNYIDWSAFVQGCYSPEELDILERVGRLLPSPVTFYDVGANIGHHTLFMAPRVDRVIAFEPFAPVRDEMARKLDFAGIKNVSIHQVALSDQDGTATFHAPAGANQGTGSLAHVPDNGAGSVLSVSTARGDAYLRENELPAISIMKIDVEGHEAAVLAGLHETILRDRPPILMEISGADRSGFYTEERLRDAIYPDARIFELWSRRGRAKLMPFSMERANEILILPADFPTTKLTGA